MADNEARKRRPVVWNRYELGILLQFDALDVWSNIHRAASESTTAGNNLTRRVAQNRHRRNGCNNVFFDFRVGWLGKDENTALYWCGRRPPWVQGNR